jgi:hypothetical protein
MTMTTNGSAVEVYLEVAAKRVFAGAVDWPGWCRGGRDEASALEALAAAAPRYARAMAHAGLTPPPVAAAAGLVVVERLPGNATTDFGAPDVPPSGDGEPLDDAELQRLSKVLEACWAALDQAAEAVEGVTLRTGPRGGGRDLAGVLAHVLGAEQSYVGRLGVRVPKQEGEELRATMARTRRLALEALAAAAHGAAPSQGPRGGKRWPPRYFVRRVAWHVLDHAWELEDRAAP